MNSRRRVILIIYGLAVAFTFVWVPWHGYEGLKSRADPTNLGFALIWSPPEPPTEFVHYSDALSKFSPFAGATPPTAPAGNISPFAYKTASVDYGRVGLEFGALTVIFLVIWPFSILRAAREASRPK